MIEYGINTSWKISIKINQKIELYTGKIIEETDSHIKIYTIKSETRVISKKDVVNAFKWRGE